MMYLGEHTALNKSVISVIARLYDTEDYPNINYRCTTAIKIDHHFFTLLSHCFDFYSIILLYMYGRISVSNVIKTHRTYHFRGGGSELRTVTTDVVLIKTMIWNV